MKEKGNGCPFCAGKRATPQTSLQDLAPDLVREWDIERNGSLLPEKLIEEIAREPQEPAASGGEPARSGARRW
jgi:hypothetical protein